MVFNKIKLSENLKSFLSDSIIYTFLNIFNKAIPFVLLPIIVRLVSTEIYGEYSLFVVLESLLIPIISLNIHVAISTHFYIENIDLKEYISTIIFSFYALVGVSLCFIVILPEKIILLSGLSKDYFFMALFTASIMGLMVMVSSLFRLQRKPWRYGFYSLSQSFLLLIIILSFCLWNPSFHMLVLGRITFSIIFFLITIYILFRSKFLALTFSKNWFKRALKFSFPTAFYSISAFIFLSSDRFLINHFLGKEDVGLYSAIFQLASVVSVVSMSLNAAWMPWLFENLKKNDEKINTFIVKLSYALIIGLLFIGLIACLVFPFIARIILPEQYHAYLSIAYPIIFGFAIQGIYFIVSPYVFYREKTKYNAYIGGFVAIINVLLNILLIPKLGIQGAAYAALFTWILLASLFFIFSIKVHKMPWQIIVGRRIETL
jgi:O-antigen/teichoic acid export membrane protein